MTSLNALNSDSFGIVAGFLNSAEQAALAPVSHELRDSVEIVRERIFSEIKGSPAKKGLLNVQFFLENAKMFRGAASSSQKLQILQTILQKLDPSMRAATLRKYQEVDSLGDEGLFVCACYCNDLDLLKKLNLSFISEDAFEEGFVAAAKENCHDALDVLSRSELAQERPDLLKKCILSAINELSTANQNAESIRKLLQRDPSANLNEALVQAVGTRGRPSQRELLKLFSQSTTIQRNYNEYAHEENRGGNGAGLHCALIRGVDANELEAVQLLITALKPSRQIVEAVRQRAIDVKEGIESGSLTQDDLIEYPNLVPDALHREEMIQLLDNTLETHEEQPEPNFARELPFFDVEEQDLEELFADPHVEPIAVANPARAYEPLDIIQFVSDAAFFAIDTLQQSLRGFFRI